MLRNAVVASLLISLLASTAASAAAYTFAPITVQGGTFTVKGLNDIGGYVGEFNDGVRSQTGALVQGGVASRLTVPDDHGFTFYSLNGVNNSNFIVGQAGHHFDYGYGYQNGSLLTVDDGHSLASMANDVNNLGLIVGNYITSTPPFDSLGFTNSAGAFVTFKVPGSSFTRANGVDDTGRIVGTYALPGSSGTLGFLLADGIYNTLQAPGAVQTIPLGISNSGLVVGTYLDARGQHGFVESGGVYQDLTDAAGAAFLPVGINNLGAIAGSFAYEAAETGSYLATPGSEVQPVPEPSSFTILVLASLGAISVRLHRSRARQA